MSGFEGHGERESRAALVLVSVSVLDAWMPWCIRVWMGGGEVLHSNVSGLRSGLGPAWNLNSLEGES